MKSQKKYIAFLYDCSLNAYDKLYSEEQKAKYHFILNWIKKYFNNILDIGIGTGIYFDNLTNDYYIIGVDISFKSLKKAYLRGIHKSIDLILSDGEYPPIREQSIDYLISITVLHHFKDVYSFIKRIYELVRKGFALSLLDRVYNKEFISKLSREFGFKYTKVENDYILLYRVK